MLLMPGRASTAQTDQSARAMDFIRHTGNDLTSLADGAATSDAERPRLQDFLDRVVDVNGVARFCLGRFWSTASNGQQRTYLALFRRVSLRNVVA
jgi:phospholipid transport system substrate-binding protein